MCVLLICALLIELCNVMYSNVNVFQLTSFDFDFDFDWYKIRLSLSWWWQRLLRLMPQDLSPLTASMYANSISRNHYGRAKITSSITKTNTLVGHFTHVNRQANNIKIDPISTNKNQLPMITPMLQQNTTNPKVTRPIGKAKNATNIYGDILTFTDILPYSKRLTSKCW